MLYRNPVGAAMVVLASCGAPAEPGRAPAPLGQEATDSDTEWWSIVQATIQADSRSFRLAQGSFVAQVGAVRGEVGLDGFRAGRLGAPLHLQFVTWGSITMDGAAWRRVASTRPVPGACTEERHTDGSCIRRVEVRHGTVTEWWATTAHGFEQGWVLEQGPGEAGVLGLAVDIGDAQAELHEGVVHLTDAAGERWRYGAPRAWDANGRTLPAKLSLSDAGIVVEVDTRGADWPVEVDPVLTSAATQLDGDPFATDLGDAVAGAGDVNGDGHSDVIVGAPYTLSTGRAFLYLGTSGGLDTVAATTLTGGGTDDFFGCSIDGAGDVNGDGFDDVIIGAKCHSSVASCAGRAFVHHGSASGLSETASTTISGTMADEFLGAAVAGIGDVNGDGYADVAIGAPGRSSSSGQARVFHGSAAGVSTSSTTTLPGGGSGQATGSALAGADVNNDGYADVVVGSPGYSSDAGQIQIHHGSAAGVSSSAARRIVGSASSRLGEALAGLGDVNQDGYDDIAAGAPAASSARGSVYVYQGSASGIPATAARSLNGDASGDYFGWALGGGGDLNADGYDDLVVGSPGYSSETGRVRTYHGSSTGIGGSAARTVAGTASSSQFGRAVALVGNVNGDSYDDVVVGTPYWSTDEGRVDLYLGSSNGMSGLITASCFGNTGGSFAASVAGAGDVNADGYEDVVVGWPFWNAATGRAYVFAGSDAGVDPVALTVLEGGSDSDYFGIAVAGAGDVNADGFADVLVGAYGAGTGGEAYIFHGALEGPGSAAATTLVGGDTYFGYSLTAAGDVDADGYDDVAVGEFGYATDRGRVQVFHGSVTGVDSAAAASLIGEAPGDLFGYSLRAAGDVNGDGFGDLVVGAVGNTSWTGRAYVYVGSASGLGSTAGTSLTGAGIGDEFGRSVAGAGDVDGDGYDDVMIAAPEVAGGGAAYLYAGGPGGTASLASTTLAGSTEGDVRVVTGLGDVDADGFDDVGVGAETWSGSTGHALVFLGDPAGLASEPVSILAGEAENHAFGAALAGAGDVNGDGFADLVVGANGYADFEGRGYVYHGYDEDSDGDGARDGTDCVPADPSIYPGAPEVCEDGVDQDCDGADAGCPAACTVSLLVPADGADLTAEGRFAWDGDCVGYWVELSPHADFPAYDSIYTARLSDSAGAQALVFPSAAWPNAVRRFVNGGYARVRGGADGEVVSSNVVSFVASGIASAFPAPVATCTVANVDPVEGSTISGEPTFSWSTSCTAARLEFSTDPSFPLEETLVIGAFSANRATLVAARWTAVSLAQPAGGYWRVVAGAADGEHASAPFSWTP